MAKKKKAKKPLTEEQKKEQVRKKKEAAFKRKIRTTFMAAGFLIFPAMEKSLKSDLESLNLITCSYTTMWF